MNDCVSRRFCVITLCDSYWIRSSASKSFLPRPRTRSRKAVHVALYTVIVTNALLCQYRVLLIRSPPVSGGTLSRSLVWMAAGRAGQQRGAMSVNYVSPDRCNPSAGQTSVAAKRGDESGSRFPRENIYQSVGHPVVPPSHATPRPATILYTLR